MDDKISISTKDSLKAVLDESMSSTDMVKKSSIKKARLKSFVSIIKRLYRTKKVIIDEIRLMNTAAICSSWKIKVKK
jgi:hypothetical protein